MKKILLSSIRFYKKYVSFLTYGSCRFTPTCSNYMYEAIEAYGIITGLRLGVRRILRCHPWNKGGYDPIPTKLKTSNLKLQNLKTKV